MGMPRLHFAYMLVADVGGSSARWALATRHQQNDIPPKTGHPFSAAPDQVFVKTEGFHPYHNEDTKLYSLLSAHVLPAVGKRNIGEVYYYGTGCSTVEMCNRIEAVLRKSFADSRIEVAHDMLGAARAICGTNPGITCILGTGSNSCVYDGSSITRQQVSLGYILGDEGSGAHLGKLLLTEVLSNRLPDHLSAAFSAFSARHFGHNSLLQHLYRTSNPSQFLGSLVPFLAEHVHEHAISHLLERSFNQFFDYYVSLYPETSTLPVHFTGGLAIEFKDIILRLCAERSWQTGQVTGDPMEGILEFHQKNYRQ